MIQNLHMTTTLQRAGTYPLTSEELVTLNTYEAIAEKWDSEYTHQRWKAGDWDVFISGLPTEASILDLGCGTAIQTAS
jgi:hypothetical protein